MPSPWGYFPPGIDLNLLGFLNWQESSLPLVSPGKTSFYYIYQEFQNLSIKVFKFEQELIRHYLNGILLFYVLFSNEGCLFD